MTCSKTLVKPAVALNSIPDELLHDVELKLAMDALLPSNYSFEVHKTIWQIRKYKIKRMALQMPEGLSMWACALCDILERFTDAEALVLGDVTYGACCVDDYTARALGCDMLVHYGHSCLIPVDQTSIRTLYVFVEITVDRWHLAETVLFNFPPANAAPSSSDALLDISSPHIPAAVDKAFTLACVGTVQFLGAVQNLGADLGEAEQRQSTRLAITSSEDQGAAEESNPRRKIEVIVPQVKPLSPGEILGCTAPRLPAGTDAILYVGDGRFHLESIMIANPTVPAYRYDPYEKRLTSEGYNHAEMQHLRGQAVVSAQDSLKPLVKAESTWAVVLGTLGRQGSVNVLKSVTKHLPSDQAVPILMSELSPAKLALLQDIDVFVQTSCPRLSIDWGYAFTKPLLSPYEANIALGKARPWSQTQSTYAMDFWADNSGGEWTPRFEVGLKAQKMREERDARAAERARVRALKAAA